MKAPYTLQSAIERIPALLGLFAVALTWIHPEAALAANLQTSGHEALVFEIKQENSEELIRPKQTFLTLEDIQNSDPDFHYQKLLQEYLTAKRSPMANCTDVLTKLDTHEKILSLSAAESSFGKRTTKGTFNYWGVMQGRGLKKMGNSPCEAVVNMDKFLNEYPRRSAIKYDDMTYAQMCGIYKVPCKEKSSHHWVKNNNQIISDLRALTAQANKLADDYKMTVALADQEIALQ